ncbi:oligopeptide/dipeptide ABC transporter ATP-binding protein [Anaerococcus sp. AGMB09787]|uniref:ABC transporter ATP-binding protein n=1 Tax=Anaerococcus sp. AGMB09787 TaxID=2922869 RepID=UPI001FAF96DA|nr:oligopeptide/dipeptide ABC transporter ATP-binding protein [Anaerococcus sp. AGMB09787]
MKSSNNELVFDVRGLKTYFPIYEGTFKKKKVNDVKAVDNVTFTVKRGETIGVVGESGCGKTTLGRSIMRLEEPTGGEVLYNLHGTMTDITKFNKDQLFDFRKEVQMVFQDPYSALNPMRKIYDSFAEPLKAHGVNSKEDLEMIMEDRLRRVNLRPEFIYRYPHEFSGGQRQRLCIARALSVSPEVVILDEPVSALDVSIQAQVINLLQDIQKELDLTYVFIAHDLSVVEYISDRIIVMYLGHILEYADSVELNRKPAHPYTEALLSAVPIPEVGRESKRIVLEGDVPSPIHKPSGCPFHNRCPKYIGEICEQKVPEFKDLGNGHFVACHLYQGK